MRKSAITHTLAATYTGSKKALKAANSPAPSLPIVVNRLPPDNQPEQIPNNMDENDENENEEDQYDSGKNKDGNGDDDNLFQSEEVATGTPDIWDGIYPDFILDRLSRLPDTAIGKNSKPLYKSYKKWSVLKDVQKNKCVAWFTDNRPSYGGKKLE